MKENDKIKLCCNCKHYRVLITEEPCLTCGLVVDERNNWEPKEDVDEIKLKPCPFCGGEPYFYTKALGEENGALKFYFRIACRRCQTSPNNAYGDIKIHLLDNGELSISPDDRKKVAAEWNRRATG